MKTSKKTPNQGEKPHNRLDVFTSPNLETGQDLLTDGKEVTSTVPHRNGNREEPFSKGPLSVRDQLGRYMKGGRNNPKVFTSEEELREAIITYLERCESENKIATVSGLAVQLGFRTRNSLLNYEKAPGYEKYHDLIQFAKLKIMEGYENAMIAGRGNIIALIFALKNQGAESWTDRQDIRVDQRTVQLQGFKMIRNDSDNTTEQNTAESLGPSNG